MIDLHGRKVVTARRTTINDHDRLLMLGVMPYETQPRHHSQRRAQDHQDLRPFHERVRGLDPSFRHRFAEEHHIGLESTAALQTTDQLELLPFASDGIAVRPQFGMPEWRGSSRSGCTFDRRCCTSLRAERSPHSRQSDGGDVPVQIDHRTGCPQQRVTRRRSE